MKTLVLKLQKPTIELQIKPKDVAGESDSFIAGFVRYNFEDGAAKQDRFRELNDAVLSDPDDATLRVDFDRFIKGEIVYLKNVELSIQSDNGKTTEKLKIDDTRYAKVAEGLWDSPEECLNVLTELFLSSAPYRHSLSVALFKALQNVDFAASAAKN